jgi:hypothetical protein
LYCVIPTLYQFPELQESIPTAIVESDIPFATILLPDCPTPPFDPIISRYSIEELSQSIVECIHDDKASFSALLQSLKRYERLSGISEGITDLLCYLAAHSQRLKFNLGNLRAHLPFINGSLSLFDHVRALLAGENSDGRGILLDTSNILAIKVQFEADKDQILHINGVIALTVRFIIITGTGVHKCSFSDAGLSQALSTQWGSPDTHKTSDRIKLCVKVDNLRYPALYDDFNRQWVSNVSFTAGTLKSPRVEIKVAFVTPESDTVDLLCDSFFTVDIDMIRRPKSIVS